MSVLLLCGGNLTPEYNFIGLFLGVTPDRSCSFQGTTSNANSRRYGNIGPFTFLELRTSFEQDVQLFLACSLGKVDTTLLSGLLIVLKYLFPVI